MGFRIADLNSSVPSGCILRVESRTILAVRVSSPVVCTSRNSIGFSSLRFRMLWIFGLIDVLFYRGFYMNDCSRVCVIEC